MYISYKDRAFTAEGTAGKPVDLKDCAHIKLDPDEQITFVTDSGTEYDVLRKSWGYFATPSINRLERFRLRAALIVSSESKICVVLVECGKEDEFYEYLDKQGYRLKTWLAE